MAMNQKPSWLERVKKGWPCAASALLLLLAFPPFNLGLLVFAALVPWLLSLKGATNREGWRSGYCFGLVYSLGQFVWMFLFVNNWTGKPILALVPTLIAAFIYALYFGVTGSLIALAWRRNWWWAIPFIWSGCEVIRSFMPTLAFPWGLIHTPLWVFPELIQLSAFGTAYLVSAWVVLLNVIIALAMLRVAWTQVRIPASVALVLLVASFVRHGSPWEGKPAKILVVQPGVEMAFLKPDEEARQIQAKMTELAVRLSQVEADLAIFPEGLARVGADWPPKELPFPVLGKPAFVFGAQRTEITPSGPSQRQSAVSYDGKWHFADKTRLVIFGEFVPLRNELPFLKSFNLPSGDLAPGEKTTALTAAGYKVGTLLCFEALFSDVAMAQANNEANLLAVMSIDDWYLGTPAPDQLMAASAFRAVETGLPLARAASKGITCVFDARGNVVARAPMQQTHVLTANLLLPERKSAFAGIGIFPIVAASSWLLLPLLALALKTKSDPKS